MDDIIRKKSFRKTVAIILGIAIGVVSLTLLLLPFVIERAVKTWFLEEHFTHAEIGDVDFNPFTASLAAKNVTAVGPDTGRIELEALRLKFQWLPLLQKRFYIVGLSLRNGVIDIRQTRDGWAVGGLLPGTGASDKTGEQSESWQWGLDHINLRDITIHFTGYDMEQTATITEASIGSYYTWKEDSTSSFRATAELGRGSLGIEGTLTQEPRALETEARITIQDLRLDGLTAFLQKKVVSSFTSTLGGTIDVRSTMEPDTGNGALEVNGKASFKETAVKISRGDSDIAFGQDELSIEGSASVVVKEKTVDAVTGTANIIATGFTMMETKGGKTIAAVTRVAINDISIDNTGGISATGARADEMNFFEREDSQNDKGKTSPYIVVVEALSIKNIDIRDNGYRAGDAVFNRFHGQITREKDGTVDVGRWIHDLGTRKGDQENKGSSQKAHVRLGSLKITNKSELVYADHTVSPTFTARLSSLSVHVGALDTEYPHRATPFELSAALDKYSGITIKGTVSPLSDNPLNMKLQGKVKTLDLPTLNPYLVDSSSYIVKSGHLDADVAWNIKNGMIDSEASIMISKLELEHAGSDTKPKGILSSIAGMPLDTAIANLRDRDGIVRLKVPIQGDIRNPDFGLSNTILKATANTLKSGVLSYYAPLGITLLTGAVLPAGSLWLVERLIKFATHARFNPVNFEPAKTELSADAKKYLSEVVSRLKEKPDVSIVLCGTSTMSDLEALRRDIEPQKGALENVESPSDKEKSRLVDIARQRAEAVRQFLVNNGIPAERLYLCEPGMDTASEALPRVELAI